MVAKSYIPRYRPYMDENSMNLVLFIVSLIGGFFSGLLGIGGAVILIPLMLYVPALTGVGDMNMNQVAGITMIQVLAATIFGCLAHRRHGQADTKIILTIGLPMGIFALAGSVFSKKMDSDTMLLLFGFLLLAAFTLLVKKTESESEATPSKVRYFPLRNAVTGCIVGFVSGVIGAGGGFILIPIMIRILKIPVKIAVCSSLGVIFIGALMGATGKIITLQVEWAYLLPVIAGSIPAAIAGARVSKALSPRHLHYALLALIFFTILKTWWDIFLGH